MVISEAGLDSAAMGCPLTLSIRPALRSADMNCLTLLGFMKMLLAILSLVTL